MAEQDWIEVTRQVNTTPQRTWELLTAGRNEWWPQLVFDPREGAPLRETWETEQGEGFAQGVVLEVVHGEALGFEWSDYGSEPALRARITLVQASEHTTLVRVTEDGLGDGPGSEALKAERIEGWTLHLRDLAGLVDQLNAPTPPYGVALAATPGDSSSAIELELPEDLAPTLLAQRILASLTTSNEPTRLDPLSEIGLTRTPDSLADGKDARATAARTIVAIVGPPGAGKTTFATKIVENLERGGVKAAQLPLDGFHLSNAQLGRLGLSAVKGAPDTFDAHGYVEALRRVARGEHDVYVPGFHREIEESYGADVVVPLDATVIITEGNYLLLDREPWTLARELCTETWYLEPDEHTRVDRLVLRHIEHGRSPQDAIDWALGTDQRNADAIAASRGRADLVVRLGSAQQPHS